MRSAAFSGLLFLLVGPAASAQFSLVPQLGFEQSKTTLNYNNTRSFSPLGTQTSPRLNLRMDYRLKGGHGPFVGVGSSPAVVEYNFAEPETGMTQFKAGTGRLQWRLEGGYQYTSKPIFFKKSAAAKSSAATTPAPKISTQSSCRSYAYKSRCGSSQQKSRVEKDTRWNLRLQPSAGVAYNPSVAEDFDIAQTATTSNYQYNAGNWKTALVTGMGFELGKGQQRKFTVGLYYLRGLGNLGDKTLAAQTGPKTTLTSFSSKVSNWSMTVGLPFTLAAKKTAAPPKVVEPQKPAYKKCEYYRSRCGQYRSTIRII